MNLKTGLAVVLLMVPLGRAAGADGWELLKSMAGEWEAKTPEGVMPVSYQVISNGSAVMETVKMGGENNMVTVYHRDGKALMATHFCSSGNQPRMRADSSAAADGNKVTFRFVDVTNLSSPEADHIRGVTMTFTDPGHVTEEWASRDHGKDATAVFQLTRKGN